MGEGVRGLSLTPGSGPQEVQGRYVQGARQKVKDAETVTSAFLGEDWGVTSLPKFRYHIWLPDPQ